MLYLLAQKHRPEKLEDYENGVAGAINDIQLIWHNFVETYRLVDNRFLRTSVSKENGEKLTSFNTAAWYRHPSFEDDVKHFFNFDAKVENEK
jgi:hypothetical protein